MKNNKVKVLLHIIFVAALIGIDQFTKYLVTTNLTNGREISVVDGVFKFVFHKNTGAVWGLFSDFTLGLTIFTTILSCFLIWFYFRIPFGVKRFYALRVISLLIFAGAIGNLIDRIRLKYVVDFLYFELIDFPVFNVADCYITVSEILLLILMIFYYKEADFDLLFKKRTENK